MLIESFLNHLRFQRRYSLHTLTAYQKDLEDFHLFFQEEYDCENWEEVNHQIVRSWIVNLAEKDISNRSINRKLSALKSFFKFLIRDGFIKVNPMAKVLAPRQSKKLLRVVNEEEMLQMLNPDNFPNDRMGHVEKMILHLFYNTGIRLSELINLKYKDVDFFNNSIRVLGKRNKERNIPFSENFKEYLEEYLSLEGSYREMQNDDWFFVTKSGKKLYPKLVYNIVNNYISTVSTIEKKSPHVLRHTFATHLLNRGADLNSIKELLGHTNLSATQVYTHNSVEQIKNMYNNTHPRGNKKS